MYCTVERILIFVRGVSAGEGFAGAFFDGEEDVHGEAWRQGPFNRDAIGISGQASGACGAFLAFSSDIHSLVLLHSTFPRAMLNAEDCQMTGATRPVRDPLHSAGAPWGNECGSSVQPQAPSLQNLIANGILESLLTSSKQTTAIPSNREKFRVSHICKNAWKMSFYFLRGAAYRRARALPEPSSMVRKTSTGRLVTDSRRPLGHQISSESTRAWEPRPKKMRGSCAEQ